MEVIADPASFPAVASGTAVSIGAYDGVHVGHRALIGRLRELAERRSLASVVVTFDRHPAAVVRPDSAPKLLTDLEQKLELLAATAVDYTLVIHFDEERAGEPAAEFVTEVLVNAAQAKVISVGEDFHFGHKRQGNVAMLHAMGQTLGFEVAPLGRVAVPGEDEPVSSTRIRRALAAGDIDLTARLLGRHHQVRGVVRGGARRGGASLGYPTANVEVPAEIQLPAEGIYAGWYIRPDGRPHRAAISLGRRPTFYESAEPLLEAHLLDFEGDLYDERARVSFVAHLRDEQRFESVDALVAQIGRDVEATREALA